LTTLSELRYFSFISIFGQEDRSSVLLAILAKHLEKAAHRDKRSASPAIGYACKLMVPIVFLSLGGKLLIRFIFSTCIVIVFINIASRVLDMTSSYFMLFIVARTLKLVVVFLILVEVGHLCFLYIKDLLLYLDSVLCSRFDKELLADRLAGENESVCMVFTVPALVRLNPAMAVRHFKMTKNSCVDKFLVPDFHIMVLLLIRQSFIQYLRINCRFEHLQLRSISDGWISIFAIRVWV
jgi:hypothetical protein